MAPNGQRTADDCDGHHKQTLTSLAEKRFITQPQRLERGAVPC